MLSRITIVGLSLFLLSGCKFGLGDEYNDAGTISSKQIEFVRIGGQNCPQPPKAIPADAKCATVKFSYPEITKATTPEVTDAINTFIKERLLDADTPDRQAAADMEIMANDFIAEYLRSPNQFSNWELERNINIVYKNADIITLLAKHYDYTGGAHPTSAQYYYVLDAKTGQAIALKDLFNAGFEGELTVAGERAFREARELDTDTNLENEGFWFENNVFSLNNNFGITETGLAFIFNPYEVAPYALGSSEFVIPYEDIMSLIPPNTPLTKIGE